MGRGHDYETPATHEIKQSAGRHHVSRWERGGEGSTKVGGGCGRGRYLSADHQHTPRGGTQAWVFSSLRHIHKKTSASMSVPSTMWGRDCNHGHPTREPGGLQGVALKDCACTQGGELRTQQAAAAHGCVCSSGTIPISAAQESGPLGLRRARSGKDSPKHANSGSL